MVALPEIVGTLPQWIAAMSSAGVLAAVLAFITRWRGQSLDTDEKIRDHYAQEVKRLTEKLNEQTKLFRDDMQAMETHYRKMLDDSDRRHEECAKDRDALRQEMNLMHDEIAGLKRQIARYSADRVVLLGDDPYSPKAPEAKRAARRVKKITEKPKRDEGDDL